MLKRSRDRKGCWRTPPHACNLLKSIQRPNEAKVDSSVVRVERGDRLRSCTLDNLIQGETKTNLGLGCPEKISRPTVIDDY